MGFFETVTELLTGGTVKTIADTIKDYFPPAMNDKDKADLSIAVAKIENDKNIELLKLANAQDTEFNQRIKDLEGTASDLKALPFFGSVLLFLRGAQRPVWGFATIVLDYQIFANQWSADTGTPKAAAFLAINVLVLGFLFGERAIMNVLPLLKEFFKAK